MKDIENIREMLGECGKHLSNEQILLLDSVYTKLAKRLVFQYVAMLKKQREII